MTLLQQLEAVLSDHRPFGQFCKCGVRFSESLKEQNSRYQWERHVAKEIEKLFPPDPISTWQLGRPFYWEEEAKKLVADRSLNSDSLIKIP